ncbi:MAG: polysaccharide deacetylase family protein [Candidatus Cloacimonetes bacterium]|nr:polysaccharide deacetylase family protein [Candidatus Cloacimonadota bacterium]
MRKIFSLLIIFILGCTSPTTLTNKKPYIVITFDDEYESQYTHALPILDEFGYKVTNFINTGKIGSRGKCNWQQIEDLEFVHGWETGGHTLNHPYLPNCDLEVVKYEVHQDWLNLKNRGLSHESFALPSGSVCEEHLGIILDDYKNLRCSMDNVSFYPIDRTMLGYFSYDSSFTPQTMISRFIRAVENKEYAVILGFHKIHPDDEGFGGNCPPDEFREIMKWLYDNDFEVITIKELMKKQN